MRPDRAQLVEVSKRLQDQTDVPGWVVASQAMVLAIAMGRPRVYGPRERWFFRVFNVLGVTPAARVALQWLGRLVVTVWWWRCRRTAATARAAERVFVGFGAGPEPLMFERFRQESAGQVAHVDQNDSRSLAQVAKPSLGMLWSRSSIEARRVIEGLRDAQNPVVRDHARQWLVSAAIRFSAYVYIRAWMDSLPERISELVFISGDVHAFAALEAADSRLRIEYRQHGLHAIGIVFPPFRHVIATNQFEANHIRTRLPGADIAVSEPTSTAAPITAHTRTVLVVSPYESQWFRKANHVEVIEDVLAWARANELTVIVRPHPAQGGEFWRAHFPQIPLDDTRVEFRDSLERLKPLFVIGWWSTCLPEALTAGVVPVMVARGGGEFVQTSIFPLKQTTVDWETGQELLSDLVRLPASYSDALAVLQAGRGPVRSSSLQQ